MMSSVMPSEKYSCSGSPLRLAKGSTAMAGRSGSGSAGRDGSWISSRRLDAPVDWSTDCVRTAPTKRRPLRGMVRISFWSSPLSPTALRAALMRLVSVDSDTIRPPQTAAIRSSLLTTRSRFCTRYTRRSNTWGSTAIGSGTAAKLAAVGIERMIVKEKLHGTLKSGPRRRPQGIIKVLSRTNQASGKVFRSRLPSSSSPQGRSS